MKRLFAFALIVLAGGILLATPTAEAACNPAQTMGTVGYLVFPGEPNDTSTFVGQFWETGNQGGMNQGTVPLTDWFFYLDPSYGGTYPYWFTMINPNNGAAVNLGDSRVVGCPPTGVAGENAEMSLFVDNCESNEGMILTIRRTPYGDWSWDFAYYGMGATYVNAGNSPRPRIGTSGRDGDIINVTYTVESFADAVQQGTGVTGGTVSQSQVFSIASATPPNISSTAGWVAESGVFSGTGGGSGSAALDCSNTAVDQWLATGVMVDGDVVFSCPVRVECDVTLADPGSPGPGLKKIKRPRGQVRRDSHN